MPCKEALWKRQNRQQIKNSIEWISPDMELVIVTVINVKTN